MPKSPSSKRLLVAQEKVNIMLLAIFHGVSVMFIGDGFFLQNVIIAQTILSASNIYSATTSNFADCSIYDTIRILGTLISQTGEPIF